VQTKFVYCYYISTRQRTDFDPYPYRIYCCLFSQTNASFWLHLFFTHSPYDVRNSWGNRTPIYLLPMCFSIWFSLVLFGVCTYIYIQYIQYIVCIYWVSFRNTFFFLRWVPILHYLLWWKKMHMHLKCCLFVFSVKRYLHVHINLVFCCLTRFQANWNW